MKGLNAVYVFYFNWQDRTKPDCVISTFDLIGYTISDFGELQVPDIKNQYFSSSGSLVKNPLECGAVAEKVG